MTILKRGDSGENGRFAWILDPDGNKVELLERIAAIEKKKNA